MTTIDDFWTTDVSGLYTVTNWDEGGIHPHQSVAAIEELLVGGSPTEGTVPASYTRLVLHWEREDRRRPGVVGTETLTLDLEDLVSGKVYAFQDGGVRVNYAMATPSLGQGARAVELTGQVRVDEVTPSDVLLEVDLSATMARLDREATFAETIRGHFRVPRRKSQ